ncbi:MAG: sugar ABC transporter permease [Lachnospiraceae bacterium]|nr:sugar ABC transporter permease [Lachnospiraceae bacterium]
MNKKSLGSILARDFKRNKWKYLVILPVVAYLILFHYKPLYGVIIAFKRFKPHLGIIDSPWVGLQHFKSLVTDMYFTRSLRNTLTISLLTLIFSFPAPVLLALLLNEVKSSKVKRTVQTITYMPHFVATVIVCGMIVSFTQSSGLFNDIIAFFGGKRTNLLIQEKYFYPIYIISGIWQNVGWNSIIYLAALSGIDQEQYEAAKVDGANRLQQLWYITLPGLIPTISMLLIMRMGSLLSVGFEKILLLYQPATYEVADVISTYAYRRGLVESNYSYSTAVGLFNSVINVILMTTANKLSKKLGQSGLY